MKYEAAICRPMPAISSKFLQFHNRNKTGYFFNARSTVLLPEAVRRMK